MGTPKALGWETRIAQFKGLTFDKVNDALKGCADRVMYKNYTGTTKNNLSIYRCEYHNLMVRKLLLCTLK